MPKYAHQHAISQPYGVLLKALLKMQHIDTIIPLTEMSAKLNLILKYHRSVSILAEKKIDFIIYFGNNSNSLSFHLHRKDFEVKFRFRLGIHCISKNI